MYLCFNLIIKNEEYVKHFKTILNLTWAFLTKTHILQIWNGILKTDGGFGLLQPSICYTEFISQLHINHS